MLMRASTFTRGSETSKRRIYHSTAARNLVFSTWRGTTRERTSCCPCPCFLIVVQMYVFCKRRKSWSDADSVAYASIVAAVAADAVVLLLTYWRTLDVHRALSKGNRKHSLVSMVVKNGRSHCTATCADLPYPGLGRRYSLLYVSPV